MIFNSHERLIMASETVVGGLIDSLSSENEMLWPSDEWPAIKFDRPLAVGAIGGHGPVRYVVSAYAPGRRVVFDFTSPTGFRGSHAFEVVAHAIDQTLLRHELRMSVSGWAKLSWPLFFRPMHDALIEESFDRAERECGGVPARMHQRSAWVRILRAQLSKHMAL